MVLRDGADRPFPLLAPLAARYATWLGLPAAVRGEPGEEEPASVRAMPLILRRERAAPPPRSALLAAAGSAAVALCLDERSRAGGPWYPEVAPWTRGRIRKLTRRARGAQWRAVTELPPDDPQPIPQGMAVLYFPPAPAMTVGKAAAQAGHATMLLAALLDAEGRCAELDRWAAEGCRCVVRTASVQEWARLEVCQKPDRAWRERGVLVVRDAGFTEVAPGTLTVAAQWVSPRE